jgi:purine catabolism regulator
VLTLEQLLSEVGLKLASGHDAAGVAVRWVHSTELLDPTPWLSGGELLLTTGIQLTDEAVQREFVQRLAANGIAGLGLGIGFTHAGLPAGVLAAAADLGFPVFEVPYELPFIALTERASAHLVNEQYEALRRSVAIQARLERLVLEQRGLGELVAAVAGAVGGAAGVLDTQGDALAWSAIERDVPARVLAEIGHRLRDAGAVGAQAAAAPLELRVAEPWQEVLALPVVAGDRAGPYAWLVATRADRRLGDFERLILQQTVTVVALELMRRRIEGDTERRLAGDILAEALTGRLDADELGARLRPFGIGDSAAVLAFALEDPVAAESLLAGALDRAGVPALVATRGALLCAVIDATGVDPVEIARQARAELAAAGDMRAAASRAAPVNALRRSFHEARCALEAVRLRNGTAPEVASHVDLGAFHLLLSLQDDDALRSYCQGVLAPVEEGDNGYGDELLRSLDAYIEHNGHWERAAAALYCHRHTLRYRIRRVEELTGRDFGNARDRIEFWLALRGRELAR